MKHPRFRFNLNIGTVIFGAIFIYLIITFFLFISHRHVETYQVIIGPLSGNETTTALILRDEDLCLSTTAGYVNHFVSNGSKTGKGQLVCAVTSDVVPSEYKKLQSSEYAELRKLASKSSRSYNNVHFDTVSDLKFDILSTLWNADAVSSSSGNFYKSISDGYISYSSDGFSYTDENELTAEDFKTVAYTIPKIGNQSMVEAGNALYRLTYGEDWNIYFPISDKQTIRLAELSNMRIKFLKDGTFESGKLSFFQNGGQRFARITMSSGMYRYLDDRFVDIELITNNKVGLKLPVSAIVKKDFYMIPSDFIVFAENEEAGIYYESRQEDGSVQRVYKEITLYAETENSETGKKYCYVDMSEFDDTTVLANPLTNERFQISETGTLDGVYCVNKGYAVFRKISMIDRNDEYCIVETGTAYGLSQYDYIVKNGNTVKESDIIY